MSLELFRNIHAKIPDIVVFGDAQNAACLSVCSHYRYALLRRWNETRPWVTWCMLNPSTADASTDDPTIRKVRGFSDRWGFGGFIVVNLFAWRATDPQELGRVSNPEGHHNRSVLAAILPRSPVVVAWGGSLPRRNRSTNTVDVVKNLSWSQLQHQFWCLGRTLSNNQPRHPLMLSYSTPIERWGRPV